MSPAMTDVNFTDDPEGIVVPAVDPEAIKRSWNARRPGAREDAHRETISGELWAIAARTGTIATMTRLKLVTPWEHGEELDEGVFRVAATCPMRVYRRRMYKRAGDEIFPFDPNEFLRRLIEDTGVEHRWEPIQTKMGEGEFSFGTVTAAFKEQVPPDSEQIAKLMVRDLLWDVWSRYHRFELSPLLDQKDFTHMVALMFGGFVIENINLARKIVSPGADDPSPASIIAELERRAQGR